MTSVPSDRLELYWYGRYVRGVFLLWDQDGDPSSKLRVPAQIAHSVGAVYLLGEGRLAVALDAANVTGARLYDVIGVQRPGRTFSLKVTGAM